MTTLTDAGLARDPPFHFWLCREHQRALIEPVQEAIKKMKEELEVARG